MWNLLTAIVALEPFTESENHEISWFGRDPQGSLGWQRGKKKGRDGEVGSRGKHRQIK